jgi:ribosome-associated translation inhibitor RaiA
MRYEIFTEGTSVPDELRTYAESRVGLAVHRAADRLSFVGVRLRREDIHAADSPVECQLDVWMRGLGAVTARHADANGHVAIDRAAALLEQAILRKLRETEGATKNDQEFYAAAIAE